MVETREQAGASTLAQAEGDYKRDGRFHIAMPPGVFVAVAARGFVYLRGR
ncbi:hypothetical protein OPIT5_08695 [Opitutaceae bacterium TAV5]|nr:hypothetical protein OPIT5_08695 [Opitutaceae bacterium TAV5]